MNQHKFYFILFFAMSLIILGCGAQPDPVAVVEELYAAEQAHDVDAILDLFAEDAVVDYAGFEYKGKDMIQIYYNGLHTVDIQVTYENIQANGNTVTWNRLKGLNPTDYSTWAEQATIEDGKIVYLSSE